MQLIQTKKQDTKFQSDLKTIFSCTNKMENKKYVEGFKDMVSAHTWAFPKYERWIKSLSNEEYRALYRYCAKEHKNINGVLKGTDSNNSNEVLMMIKTITNAIMRTEVPQNVVVYRGSDKKSLGIENCELNELEGRIIEEKGFMSTSLVEKVAMKHVKKHDGGILLKVKASKGAKAGYLGNISEYMEAELLFNKNQKMIIEKATKKDDNLIVLECKLV